jgi:hypothetical protein
MSSDVMEVDADNTIQHEESKLYACFALQSKVFVGQVDELIALNKVLAAHQNDIKITAASIPVPDVLKKRLSGEKVDDFEALLLCKCKNFYFACTVFRVITLCSYFVL